MTSTTRGAAPATPRRTRSSQISGAALGRAMKNDGTARVASNAPDITDAGVKMILRIGQTAKTFSADDLHARMFMPAHVHPNVVGAMFATLRAAGALKAAGPHISSKRPAARYRKIPVYQLTATGARMAAALR